MTVLYLLDANVLITASNSYYPLDSVPQFWSWLAHQCGNRIVAMPIETFDEVKDGSTDVQQDPLFGWVQANKALLVFHRDVDANLVNQVVTQGYAPDLTDDELEQIGRDPFLIAHAFASPDDYCVVTTEVSAPAKQRQNRRIPDVCTQFGVTCCNTFKMMKDLRFSTNWQA